MIFLVHETVIYIKTKTKNAINFKTASACGIAQSQRILIFATSGAINESFSFCVIWTGALGQSEPTATCEKTLWKHCNEKLKFLWIYNVDGILCNYQSIWQKISWEQPFYTNSMLTTVRENTKNRYHAQNISWN